MDMSMHGMYVCIYTYAAFNDSICCCWCNESAHGRCSIHLRPHTQSQKKVSTNQCQFLSVKKLSPYVNDA